MCRNNVKGAKTRDRLKAQTTIFGGFDYEGVRIDYGKDGGLQSGFGNVLVVGEDKNITPTGLPFDESLISSGVISYTQGPGGAFSHSLRYRYDENTNEYRKVYDSSVDFSMPNGTELTALFDGELIFEEDRVSVDYRRGKKIDICNNTYSANIISYGCYAKLTNIKSGITVIYAHLDKANLKNLEFGKVYNVKKGDSILISDNSGYSTGPHLHLQVKQFDISGNEVLFFNDDENMDFTTNFLGISNIW